MDFFRGSLDHRLGVRNAVQKLLYVPRAKGGSHFKVCWAGKMAIGDHVTGLFDHRGGRRGLRLDPDIIGEAKPTAARSAADLSAPKRGMCRRPAIRSAVNHL